MVYVWITIIIALSVFITIMKPKIKGKAGEVAVGVLLQKLDQEKYHVVNDVMLSSSGNTKTTQIDHVVVSIYGLFSIETKNYKGQIYGTENSRQWIQTIHGHKYPFMNPIYQNYAHIKALEALLQQEGYSDIPIDSIIAFPGDTTLKVTAEKAAIVKWSAVPETIAGHSDQVCLSEEDVKKISSLLMDRKSSHAEMRKHINEIREVKRDTEQKIQAGVCPKCGNALVLRNGKYGKFYGCSHFPNCRFTTPWNEKQNPL